ncbi:hypothetical protein [Paenibacillus koleovorans]|uniref:hypothetical protein n=1 Tax=Paenibacillus koleovorans TaxID=121608 RepID=UPI000FDC2F0C|nr:hypothetical protein [Paenibacillus koleovorans]
MLRMAEDRFRNVVNDGFSGNKPGLDMQITFWSLHEWGSAGKLWSSLAAVALDETDAGMVGG